jgi:hypothetical protein
MQLLQSSANGNVDGNGKTAQATWQEKEKIVASWDGVANTLKNHEKLKLTLS